MSMISSTPLNPRKDAGSERTRRGFPADDTTVSNVSLSPIAYEEVAQNPKTPLLRSQYDKLLEKSNTGRIFKQVQLGGSCSTDEEPVAQQTPQSLLKNDKRREFADWRSNPTKYADLAFDSQHQQEVKSRFSSGLPFAEEYLPRDVVRVAGDDAGTDAGAGGPNTVDVDVDAPGRGRVARKGPPGTRSGPASPAVYRLISDPAIPYTLSLYLQLVLNAVIIGFIVLFIYTFVSTIRNDVSKRVDEMTLRLLKEISLCSKEYDRNNCHPSERVPAAERACSVWEQCMNQDPTAVGQVKISFEILAEILNGFVRLLSWKTIFVLMMLMVGSLVVTNLVFDRYRYSYNDARVHASRVAPDAAAAAAAAQELSVFGNSHYDRHGLVLQSPSAVRFDEKKRY